MKLVKKTAEYTVYQRRDERYAVEGANNKSINGDEKVKILVAEGLLKVALPKEPEPEAAAEEAPAEEASDEGDAAE